MAEVSIMARVVSRTAEGLKVAALGKRRHPDTCWCRPPEVAMEAFRGTPPVARR